ncbi:MAG: FkbM family methyltransferase [Actinomycetia bacterium]|nr:FkbM family methyltransferase [Actinomycetes bacterium]
MLRKHKAIFSQFVDANHLNFNFIDIGARGDIHSPWLELEDQSTIVGFEPDADEARRLNQKFGRRKYFDIALWSEKTAREVFINEWESTSSMYPPNTEYISKFEPQHWTGRRPKLVQSVECETLDGILNNNRIIPDFIKIDTQGSELEILKGAEFLLRRHSPMVTCETWCYEVYKGAHMMHDVIGFMDCAGYQVFDMELAASWRHKSDRVQEVSAKRKAIGYEVLFVKKFEDMSPEDGASFLKSLLLLELYGYRDYAIFLLEQKPSLSIQEGQLRELFYKNSQRESSIYVAGRNLFSRVLNRCAKQDRYPNIKY